MKLRHTCHAKYACTGSGCVRAEVSDFLAFFHVGHVSELAKRGSPANNIKESSRSEVEFKEPLQSRKIAR
jgi:hypothetical protein